jgi:hypothetical protein
MKFETYEVPENPDCRSGTVHAEYWEAYDPETGLTMPGLTEAEAIENLEGNLYGML